MQNRLVQTSSRTKISANSISNRTKISTNAINRIRLTKIGVVLDCTKIGANPIYSSNITCIPYAKANCIGRVPIRRVFNNKVVQLAIAIKAI